jgi:lipopolysaccharide transport system ATP-binding protein
MVITGQRHPEEGVFAGPFRAGQKFSVRFEFKMDAFPGAYFVGGGIWSNAEPNCMHRIMDAIMFRISEVGKQQSFGYADMSVGQPKLEVL